MVMSLDESKFSSDYPELVNRMKQRRIICVVSYQYSRDIALTYYDKETDGTEFFAVQGRGITYINAFDSDRFVDLCKAFNLKWLDPSEGV